MEPEPLEELARLLTEQKRLDEKLGETRESLSGIRKKISESLVHSSLNNSDGPIPMDEGLVQKEQTFERLLQAFVDMKGEIQTKVRLMEEEIVQANVKHLLEIRDNQKNRLEACLSTIDQSILDCRLHVENSKKIYEELNLLNEKLSSLGVEPLPVANSLGGGQFEKMIREQIEHLRLKGKI